MRQLTPQAQARNAPQSSGLRGSPLLVRPMMPSRNRLLSALNAVGVDRAVAPAFVERLLRPRVRRRPCRRTRTRQPELQDDRHPARGVLGHGEAGLNGDLDLRKGAVVDVADQRLGDRRDAAAFAFDGAW